MPDGQQYDLSTAARDPEFLKAGTNDKIAFLSAHDADFAKAPPTDKAGYINHLLGNDQETAFEKRGKAGPVERQLTSFGLGAASGASGLPESLDPLGDYAKQQAQPKGLGQVIKDAAYSTSIGPLAGIASGLYHAGKDIFAPSGSGDDAAEQRAHGFGSLAGQIAPALVGEAVDSGATTLKGTRSALAQRAVAPLVKKPLGATQNDIAFGRDPAKAITDEGLVGTKSGMINQATKRIGELSSAADQQLANHPNANTITDVEPIVDGAIDSAQQAARRSGSKAAINRLEDLREALKTEYGDLQGTPLELNRLKQKIGDTASDLGAFKHTDPLESSAASAMSDIYTRLNDHIKSQVPEVAPINDRTANLISARMGLKRNAALETNKSLFDGSLSTLPFRIFNETAGSAPVRSGAARLLNAGSTLDVPRIPRTQSPYSPPITPELMPDEESYSPRLAPQKLLSYPDTSDPVSFRGGPPPSFDPRFSVEPTGRMENPNLLGPRGLGGTRSAQRGLLPEPPPPMTPSSPYIPPTARPGTTFSEFRGLDTTPQERKLTDYTPDEIEEAKLLIRQTVDAMQSADRPGRYYSENEMGDYNPQRIQNAKKGVTSGGHWYGVKSMRTMLPWIKDTTFSPSQLDMALKRGESSPLYQRAVMSAADFVRNEKKTRQPGDED